MKDCFTHLALIALSDPIYLSPKNPKEICNLPIDSENASLQCNTFSLKAKT